MDFEWIRIITIVLALIAIVQFILFFRKTHEWGVFAPISWLAMIVANSVFKILVDGDLRYYNLAVLLNNLIFIYACGLLIVGGYLFRDIKSWTSHR